MNWTVYCMGDLPIFRDIINAVAMVFNSSLFNPTQGAGLVFVAMLISLFLFILPRVMNQPLSPFPLIFVFLIYFGGIVPKTTLQIEDIYLGTVTTVDNVPIIVAAPASIAASIAKGITDVVETAFSSPSQGSYLSLGSEGFVNPLKTLMAFRGVVKGLGFYSGNLANYTRDCAMNAPGFSNDVMNASPDVLGYLTTLQVSGITLYSSAGSPQAIAQPCTTVAAALPNDFQALMTAGASAANPSPADAAINAVVPPTGTDPVGVVNFTNAVNAITSGATTTSQNAQQFMSNLLANLPVSAGVKCANASDPALEAQCNSSFLTSTAIEQGNIDAAANASIFAKTAIPTMSILLALFYAFSPLILGVAMLSGAHGVKIIGGFLMFGAWTQSWMPIAAVLNYMVQQQAQNDFAKFGHNGVNLGNVYDFYSMVAMKIGLASELLAMTPMLSMALLTGSVFALSGVAGKFSQDRADEKALAPDYTSTGSLGHQGSRVEGDKAIDLQHVGGQMAGGVQAISNENNKTAMDIDIASGARSGVSSAIAQRNAFAVQHAHAGEQKLAEAYKQARESGDSQTTEASQQQMFSEADKHVHQITDEMGKKTQFDESTKAAVASNLTLGFKLAGSGASVASDKAYETAKSLATTDAQKDAITAAIEQARTQSMSMGHKFALSKTNKDGTELSRAYGLTDSKSDSEMNESSEAVTRALDEYNAVSGEQKVGSDVLGARLATHGYTGQLFDRVATSHLTADQKARFSTAQGRHAQQIRNANGGQPLNQAQQIDSSVQAMVSIGASGQLSDALIKTGAVAADRSILLHDTERESGMARMGVPKGVDVGQVHADAGQFNEGTVEQHAGQASGNRGSRGVDYVPVVDASGHAAKHYQSETVAMQSAIGGTLSGSPASEMAFTAEQQANHDTARADQTPILKPGESLEGHSLSRMAHDTLSSLGEAQQGNAQAANKLDQILKK